MTTLRRLWSTDAPLTFTGLLMIGRVRVTLIAAGSYTALFAVLLVQALRGEPVIAPSTFTVVLLGAWALVTAVAVAVAAASRAADARTSPSVLG